MKKALPIFLVVSIFLFRGIEAQGQIRRFGRPVDSTMFIFSISDSLAKKSITIDTNHTDITNTNLWQIGTTQKSFFADTGSGISIVTDTVNNYPVGANSWFTIKLPLWGGYGAKPSNPEISFWHKYQTDSGRDGGIVEFSMDTGKTWNNILGDCNVDNSGYVGILTDNFYKKNDTLLSGEQAFSGNSNGWIHSNVQFFYGMAVRTTGGCNWNFPDGYAYLRFRFKSDSVSDTLSGWAIKRMTVYYYYFGDLVPMVTMQSLLNVYPNPSTDGVFVFPALTDERGYAITVYNMLGQVVLQIPYTHTIDLATQVSGLYFYKVTDGQKLYSGKLNR